MENCLLAGLAAYTVDDLPGGLRGGSGQRSGTLGDRDTLRAERTRRQGRLERAERAQRGEAQVRRTRATGPRAAAAAADRQGDTGRRPGHDHNRARHAQGEAAPPALRLRRPGLGDLLLSPLPVSICPGHKSLLRSTYVDSSIAGG